MIERIQKNEERLDNAVKSIHQLSEALEEFQKYQKDIKLLNRYYGSKNWFHDKEAYEAGKLSNVKAGVLSEDAVWNMDEELREVMQEMHELVQKWEKK